MGGTVGGNRHRYEDCHLIGYTSKSEEGSGLGKVGGGVACSRATNCSVSYIQQGLSRVRCMLTDPVVVSHFAVRWYNRQECTVGKRNKRRKEMHTREEREEIKDKWKEISLHIFSYIQYYCFLLDFFSIVKYSRKHKKRRFGNWVCFLPQVR